MLMREDICCVLERDPAARNCLEVFLAYPGVHAVLFYRINHRLWQKGWKMAARWLAFLARWLTHVDIHPGAKIGRRFFIDHGAGVVIGETAEVGDEVTLYHGVTFGGTSWNKEKRHPTLGNGVMVGAGAKILGPITLGNQVRVGANSVVVKNVAAYCTVVGIPGRVIPHRGEKNQNETRINPDHNLIPDPIGKIAGCMMERMDKLEIQVAHQVREPGQCRHCEACMVCRGVG
ncbi:serine O-acetyltransferase [Candidatus Methylobacter oryzae]|uniref:serine O-acetyltransferase n=1 Tax=Candidatus Methylobacter oryzae TaxID=2497749 RepID=A0ABY3C5L8_9GAMM|nr:serine O-acetyltransferase [Candidatus Methylobacter oryzae]TRW89777.1 serine O-acetyltransferase [Candidatus Methylobacter oryzae]